jgi:hypothetical protein
VLKPGLRVGKGGVTEVCDIMYEGQFSIDLAKFLRGWARAHIQNGQKMGSLKD